MSILAPVGSPLPFSHAFSGGLSTAPLAALAAAGRTLAAEGGTGELLILLAALVVAAGVAWKIGVFRPAAVDGPLRVRPGQPVWPLAAAVALGLTVWFGANIFYVAAKQTIAAAGHAAPRAQPSGPPAPASRPDGAEGGQLTRTDFAVLSTVPGLLAFACLVAADWRISAPGPSRFGFTPGRFPDGVAKGLLALIVVMPLMFALEVALELFYQRVRYQHPGEHMLLRLMTETRSRAVRWSLIGGAILAAPFFEEYLFRGFLQTLLREAFVRWGAGRAAGAEIRAPADPDEPPPRTPAPVAPPIGAGPADGLPTVSAPLPAAPLGYAPRLAGVPPPGERVWQTWAAILVTSLAFALIHELWTAPLIFALSVCLGYAFERTGSLWTSITLHLLFNATSTAIYLGSHQ